MPEKFSKFAFSDEVTMVAYVPKKGRIVHVLSTQHSDNSISQNEHKKPIMIEDYNKSKGGVNNADKLIHEDTCASRTGRWPYGIFMNILDICALNAFILFISKYPDWMRHKLYRRKCFMLQLGDQLTNANMKIRAAKPDQKKHILEDLKNCEIDIPKTLPTKQNLERKREGFGHKKFLKVGDDDDALLTLLEADNSDIQILSDDENESDTEITEVAGCIPSEEFESDDDSDDEPLKMGFFIPLHFNSEEVEDGIEDRSNWQVENYVDMYFSDTDFQTMADCTNLRILQNTEKAMNLTLTEIKQLIGISLLLSCLRYPNVRMYWAKTTKVNAIASVMSRDRFFKIRNNLKVIVDADVPAEVKQNNRFYKIRPVIESIRNGCLSLPRFKEVAVDDDDTVHWILCTATELPKSVHLTSDVILSRMGREACEQTVRGDGKMNIVQWYAMKPIIVASTALQIDPQDQCNRWSKKESKYIRVSRPKIVAKYNQCMGGIDLINRMISYYRMGIHSKKMDSESNYTFIGHGYCKCLDPVSR
ncbi:Transposase IS4 [Popillia japonica]|uniref:Transposase IS4 n=1 Tax=Popillia japonica TaxID=7064 RepID=A0AAW1JEY3_POPJA